MNALLMRLVIALLEAVGNEQGAQVPQLAADSYRRELRPNLSGGTR